MNKNPNKANNAIAILTGGDSGIVVLDIDNLEIWTQKLQELGQTEPVTTTVDTQSGGRHLYFCADEHTKGLCNVTGIWGPGSVDFRGDDGLIFAPPTTTPHKKFGCSDDVVYTWAPGRELIQDSTLQAALMPDWLCEIIKRAGSSGAALTSASAQSNLAASEIAACQLIGECLWSAGQR